MGWRIGGLAQMASDMAALARRILSRLSPPVRAWLRAEEKLPAVPCARSATIAVCRRIEDLPR
jgi:hypothetical protein